MARLLRSAFAYFAVVFACGFVLGSIRVPFLAPRLGVRTAELLEMPIMLVVIVLAARWVARRCRVAPTVHDRLWMGIGALVLLLVMEFSLVLALQGLTIRQYLATRDPVAAGVYGLMLVAFAAMPLILARIRSRGARSASRG